MDIVGEPLDVHGLARGQERLERVGRALEEAGLRPAGTYLGRFPHELSGGQRQRVAIAAAMVLEPEIVVADEPVSMLDVSIRTGILKTMLGLRASRGVGHLFITHDLSLAWLIADRIAVMYLGRIIEEEPAARLVRAPAHPYSPDPKRRRKRTICRARPPTPRGSRRGAGSTRVARSPSTAAGSRRRRSSR